MKKNSEKVAQLQVMQQNLQNLMGQKQQFQQQMEENDSALTELSKSSKAYKIVGNLMVAGKKEELEKELEEKKEMWELRLKSIDKQEELLKKRMAELQKEAMAEMTGAKDE